MDEKELNALLEKVDAKVKEGVKAEMQSALTGTLKADDLKTRLEEMGLKGEEIKTLTDAAKVQGDKINELIASQKSKEVPETLKSRIIKVFPEIQKHVLEGGGKYKFPVNKTTIGLASITSDPQGMVIPGLVAMASQANNIAPSLNRFTLTPDDHGVIYWTDQTTRTNNAAARSDGSAAAEQVYAWTGYSETVDNVTAMVPVHKEALKHISVMEDAIKELLQDDCAVALDGYCYTGSGTAPQIGGLYTRASAFVPATYIAAGGFAPKDANMYDLIVCMAAQIMKASKYIVDRAWVNPYDALKMKLWKNEIGAYTMPPFVVPSLNGPIIVSGMQIIEANSVTAGTLVVGDSRKARLYDTGVAEIEVGYDLTGDFSKRILSILANLECSLLIRNAEVDAFLKSTDIAANIASITAEVA